MSCAGLTVVQEGSTAIVTITALDENDNPATPKTGVWTLLNSSGAVINGLKEVVITPLSSIMEVRLSGLDLPCDQSTECIVSFIFEGTYDTQVNGIGVSDTPLRGEVFFTIDNITTIP